MPLRHLFNWIFYGHIWIAVAATGLSWMTLRLAYGPPYWASETPVLTFIFLATLGVYTLHRYLSFQRSGVRPTTRRYELVRDHPTASLIIGGGSMIAAGAIGMTFIESIWSSLLWALPITVFYLTPPIKGWRRLRDLPYVKALWVAWAWTIMTWDVPVEVMRDAIQTSYVENGSGGLNLPITPASPQLPFPTEMPLRFLFTLSIALLFDFRDVVLDKSQSVKTAANQYPVLAKSIVSVAMTICIITVFRADGYSTATAWACTMAYGTTILVCWATNDQRSENWYATVVNGMLVLLPVLVGLAYYYDWYVVGSSPF
ncbi:hypothetical protein [Neolewinella agarilytica]|uniref:hypothetical protein n=1 Tax=Neolewinella agarilytica TaxID=478744 RepID=UPI0023576F71|nr:hypothetical protein [Neolewinella agarilytica]